MGLYGKRLQNRTEKQVALCRLNLESFSLLRYT